MLVMDNGYTLIQIHMFQTKYGQAVEKEISGMDGVEVLGMKLKILVYTIQSCILTQFYP